MNNSPNHEVEVFAEAVNLKPTERAAYLECACGGDAELRQKVEALLGVNDAAGDFLEESAQKTALGIRSETSVGEKAGDHIGPYKLLQTIGEGGCGVVFMAEQEAPVHRRVALKIIKPGMDTKSVVARFEAERQALALMDHPNIAKVFDAGATESGRPYFVMQLIRGVKITEYCDQHLLSTEERLKLFIQVCHAVQHAHQKGIIHRDIKPSNILVTTTLEGVAMPVVIDFGIAKATTNQRLTNRTLFTAFDMLIGTPGYMSPEQAAFAGADVDTRTDIYSLGVLLYELLTGLTPFDTEELLKAGLDEIRRVIREQEPVRPSTRLSKLTGADLTTVAERRKSEPARLIRAINGDLDWIAMKALEKNRTRRYSTANGLAMDVERCLAGEAILARPPSELYKARKLIARNKLLFSSLAIISLLLLASLAILGRLLVVERQAREAAQHRAEVFRLEALAAAHVTEQKWPEAETSFRRANEIRQQFMGGEAPNLMVIGTYVIALEKQKKNHEVIAYLTEILKPSLLTKPEYDAMCDDLARWLAVEGQWKKAAVYEAAVVEHKPDDSDAYHRLAPLLVASQDLSGYRRLCQQMILHFKDTQNPFVADSMAKDCLMLASSGVNLNTAGHMADTAVTRGKGNSAYPFFECVKALAEYRQGHFAAAAEWASLAATNAFPYSKVEALATLAMAQLKSGQTNDAQATLVACDKIIVGKFPQLSSGNLGQDWRDWIISYTLRNEAHGLIEGNNTSGEILPLSLK